MCLVLPHERIPDDTRHDLLLTPSTYSGQSYKHFMLVNYDSRVVIYAHRGFIRLATDLRYRSFLSLNWWPYFSRRLILSEEVLD